MKTISSAIFYMSEWQAKRIAPHGVRFEFCTLRHMGQYA